jgi:predicted DsbA family dithiol-disulfide isomerase
MTQAAPLSVDVVSDIICPWCFIGSRRLSQALEAMPGVAVEVAYRPFLLDPTIPPEGVDLRERLRKKYNADPETIFARVEAAGRETGIPLDFSKVRRTVSTIAGHTLLRHALEKGTPARQAALGDALFDAYFLQGRDVGQAETLAEIAGPHGFAVDETLALVRDEAELRQTRAEATEAARNGISGVPFFIFDGRLAVSGAQPVAVLRGAIERALSERGRA